MTAAIHDWSQDGGGLDLYWTGWESPREKGT
jgi:hypothetical protein